MEVKTPAELLYDELDKELWHTKHSRFNACERLRKKNALSIYTISILSVYVIAITLLSKYGFLVKNSATYDFISILLALFILVLSLTEASKNYLVSAERLFNNGNDIKGMLGRLKKYSRKTDADFEGLDQLSKEYSAILKSCPENHDNIDFELFKARKYQDFKDMNLFLSIWYKSKYYIDIFWFYSLLIILPPLIFVWSL